MRLVCLPVLCVALVAGCGQRENTVLGRPPHGVPATVVALRNGHGEASETVTLTGVMVEKCPVAGCWFRLRDRTGTIKVDTKAAGFVVVDVPLQSTLTVAGRLVADGKEIELEATGLHY